MFKITVVAGSSSVAIGTGVPKEMTISVWDELIGYIRGTVCFEAYYVCSVSEGGSDLRVPPAAKG